MRLLTLIFVLILIGCSFNGNTKIDEGLSFTLKIEKNIVKLGESVKVSFIVTNLDNKVVKLTFPSSAQTIFEIWNDQECIYCIPPVAATVITELILFSQEVKIYHEEWFQHNFDGQLVPQGNYRIIAYLDYYGSDTKLETPFIITE